MPCISPLRHRERGGDLVSMSSRDSVSASYDRIADVWQQSRAGGPFREQALVERFLSGLPQGGRILDLGCGCGEPITRFLIAAGFEVVGVDSAARLLEYARHAVPEATFLLGDMRTVDLGGSFHGIVAWDSVFHIPRAVHAALFARIARWLEPGGRLLLSLGGTAEEGFTSEMHGATFFYSGHEPEEAFGLLRAAGFRIEHSEVDDVSSRGHVAVVAVRDTRV
jgi:cyclopropane fatty-acyl-phospholipid synthase-like methyltransferase